MILARLALVMGLSCTALTAFDAKADVMEIDADGARWVAGGGAAQAAAPVETLAVEPLAEVPSEIFVPDIAVADPGTHALLVPDGYKAKVAELSARFDLSPTLIEALVWQESRWRADARSPVGARGLAQLMPGTARDLGVRAPLPEGDPSLALGTSTMTLLELTSAYAAVAANEYPVEPHAFARPERGFFENLWDGPSSLSSATHSEMERMLRAAINKGTGRAAMLSGPNFGKTGTTQDNRDALFVGYAGDLVVGVWIGNDDNSPLQGGISGGGLPARIWRDFMNRAMNVRAAPTQPAPREQQDPGTPIEPLDVPDLGDIPLGDGNSRLRIRDGEAVFSTEIDGIPVDISIGDQGVAVDEAAIEEARRRADERRYEAVRNRREELEDAAN